MVRLTCRLDFPLSSSSLLICFFNRLPPVEDAGKTRDAERTRQQDITASSEFDGRRRQARTTMSIRTFTFDVHTMFTSGGGKSNGHMTLSQSRAREKYDMAKKTYIVVLLKQGRLENELPRESELTLLRLDCLRYSYSKQKCLTVIGRHAFVPLRNVSHADRTCLTELEPVTFLSMMLRLMRWSPWGWP